MAKLAVIRRSWEMSRWGADASSRHLLFLLRLINQLDKTRRHALRHLIYWLIRRHGADGHLRLRLRRLRGRGSPRVVQVELRIDDPGDYQSLCESLDGRMYRLPGESIRHLFDGGAHLGFFSIAAALHLEGLREFVVVEANPQNVPILRRNVTSLPSVALHDAALLDRDGAADFQIATSNTGRIAGAPGHAVATGRVHVRTRRIVPMVPEEWDMGRTWLKLDIEGAEYGVLADLLGAGLRPAAISLEVHDFLHAGGEELVRSLEQAGYRVRVEGRGEEGNVCRQISAVLCGSTT